MTIKKIKTYFRQFISYVRYDIPNGIRGLIYWAPIAWRWRSWDYQYGLDAFAHHLRALEEACRMGSSVTGEAEAKRIRIALELLRRHVEDPYSDQLRTNKLSYQEYAALRERDWDYLWNLIRKYLRRWWD